VTSFSNKDYGTIMEPLPEIEWMQASEPVRDWADENRPQMHRLNEIMGSQNYAAGIQGKPLKYL